MKISKSVSRESAIRKAINQLNACLRNAKKKPILLMVSGGSALELLAGVEMRYMGRHVTVTVLDERYSKDPAVNNFSQVAETDFYKNAEYKGIDYIDTRVHYGITLHGLARKFERGLKRWKKKYPNGIVIVTQGIGEDGHTAGILPYPEDPKKFNKLFDKNERWVVGYYVPKEKSEYTRRITVTFPFLREHVDCTIVYVTGSKKRRALVRTLANRGKLSRTPSRIIHEMKNVTLFTDQNV